MFDHLLSVLNEIKAERERQDAKWGEQNHPNGTSTRLVVVADSAKERCNAMARDGKVTWEAILTEEFYEALAEEDPAKLRSELVQVAAVAVSWIQAIDRKANAS